MGAVSGMYSLPESNLNEWPYTNNNIPTADVDPTSYDMAAIDMEYVNAVIAPEDGFARS